jgi:hypothetical protein
MDGREMNDVLDGIGKYVAEAYSKYCTCIYNGGTEENHENLSHGSRYPGRYLNWEPPYNAS